MFNAKAGYRVPLADKNSDDDTVRAETSIADSRLDFPLESLPESLGHQELDTFRKPADIRAKSDWTFNEILTIS